MKAPVKKAAAKNNAVKKEKNALKRPVIQKVMKREAKRAAKRTAKRAVKVPVRWIPPVYEKVDKITLKAGSTAELTVYTVLSPHDMTYSVTMENPPKGISIVKQEVIHTTKDFTSELMKLTLKADKNAEKGVYNQVFKVKMQFDASPDKNGDIKRRESLVPLPVLRMEVK